MEYRASRPGFQPPISPSTARVHIRPSPGRFYHPPPRGPGGSGSGGRPEFLRESSCLRARCDFIPGAPLANGPRKRGQPPARVEQSSTTLRTGKGRMDQETILDYRYFVEPAAPHCTRSWARILLSAPLACPQADSDINGENDNGRRSHQLPASEARPRCEAVRESVNQHQGPRELGRPTWPDDQPDFAARISAASKERR